MVKIVNAAVGIAIVAISLFVAVLAHNDVKRALDSRTKQIEDMIIEHRTIVYRNHDTLMGNEQRLVKITLDQNKVLDQIVSNGGKIQEMVKTNQEFIRDLRAMLTDQLHSSPGP